MTAVIRINVVCKIFVKYSCNNIFVNYIQARTMYLLYKLVQVHKINLNQLLHTICGFH